MSPSLDTLLPCTIQTHCSKYCHMFTLRSSGSLGTHGTSHSSGWSNGDKFLEFLCHFIYHVKPTKDDQLLLLLDNHESHITVPEITKCQENAAIMLTFCPHISQKLQPLHNVASSRATQENLFLFIILLTSLVWHTQELSSHLIPSLDFVLLVCGL